VISVIEDNREDVMLNITAEVLREDGYNEPEIESLVGGMESPPQIKSGTGEALEVARGMGSNPQE
jgi:hypothetical protein